MDDDIIPCAKADSNLILEIQTPSHQLTTLEDRDSEKSHLIEGIPSDSFDISRVIHRANLQER